MTTEKRPGYYPDIVKLYEQVLAMESQKKVTHRQRRHLLNDVRSIIPAAQNRWNFRWVIWPLGLLALAVPALIIIQTFVTKTIVTEVPDGLLSLAATAVGALTAFLAPFGQKSQQIAAEPLSGDDATPEEQANAKPPGSDSGQKDPDPPSSDDTTPEGQANAKPPGSDSGQKDPDPPSSDDTTPEGQANAKTPDSKSRLKDPIPQSSDAATQRGQKNGEPSGKT